MTDPFFGSIYGSQSTLNIRDNREAPPEEPQVYLEMADPSIGLNLGQLTKLIATLRQAQDSMIARKERALCNRTLPLF